MSKDTSVVPPKKKPAIAKWGGGFFKQQAEMAYPPHLAEFNREVLASYKGFFNLKITPGKVDNFEAAVLEQGLTEEFLNKKMARLKNLQITMYCFSCFVFLYGFWLALEGMVLAGLVTFLWASGIAIRGYLFAFRAWQIQNRALIRLQDAVKIKSTYIVL